MYGQAYKHIELFKKIPFKQFAVNADFINNVVTNPEQYATYENIIKVYYFIAEELWDPLNIKPTISNESNKICFYDFVTKKPGFVNKSYYQTPKLFNAVFNKDGFNRHFKRYHGLVAQPKTKAQKQEAYRLRDMFISYAHMCNDNLTFYKRQKYEISTQWAERLYANLNGLSENVIFFYKQRGDTTLAQEMINVLSNQFMLKRALQRIMISKESREKIIRQIEQTKQFMFGELKHDKERYAQIKATLQQRQQ